MEKTAVWKNVVFHYIRSFFLPEYNSKLKLRLIILLIVLPCFFLIFRPCFISGKSMAPAWNDGGFTFSYRLRYLFAPPQRGDVVCISYFGRKMLLKRVVALAGDVVEFKDGNLLVNGVLQEEEYVKFPCKWNIAPVTVRDGFCYAVGDNRSMSHLEHKFGEVSLKRIVGGPLF